MNSGILGILTHQSPYQFRGLKIISTIFYVLDLTLFVIFSIIFTTRFIMFRWEAYNAIVSNQTDLMFCACWPIAWMTLTTLTPLICSNAYWGHHAFTILGYVMWWIAAAWCLAVLFWAFAALIESHKAETERIPMAIILPAVSVSTAAVTGAFVVSMSWHVSARLAVPVIVCAYMLLGMGTLLGLMLTTYLFHGYLAQGWPEAAQTPTVFIFIGPMGQGASALIQLGRAARVYGAFGGYNKGLFLTADSAAAIHAVSVMLALMLTGLGVIWVGFGIYAMIRRAVRRELFWTHAWNSIIFPTGTLVTSMELFALEMDSPAFRVVAVGMLIVLVVVFLVNLSFVIAKVGKGDLLIVREKTA
jgi:tellurite resistance protein TehA-like permease